MIATVDAGPQGTDFLVWQLLHWSLERMSLCLLFSRPAVRLCGQPTMNPQPVHDSGAGKGLRRWSHLADSSRPRQSIQRWDDRLVRDGVCLGAEGIVALFHKVSEPSEPESKARKKHTLGSDPSEKPVRDQLQDDLNAQCFT